jgi:O-antigen chain-terminating methyltransferase
LKAISQDLIETTAVAAKKSQDFEERLKTALPRLETLSGQLRQEVEVRDRFITQLRASVAQESEAWRRATQELQAGVAQERERNQAEFAQVREHSQVELAQERERSQAELAQVRERSEAELSQLRTRLEDLTNAAAASANDVARILDEQHKQSDELSRHADRQVETDNALRVNLEHLKASGQALQAYLERLENRQLSDATYLKDEILVHRHVFRELVSRGVAFPHSPKEEESPGLDHQHDAFYLAFEDRFRGSRNDVKSRCEVYLPYLASVTIPKTDCHILDIGSGRGEWLELLRQNDFVSVSGVDTNVAMAAQCRDQGFSVEIQDCVDHLTSLQTGSLTVITAFHVIEHLPFERQMLFLSEAYRVLARGGMLIFETPNPDNLIVAAKNFYIDPTHRRPLPSPLAAFLVEHTGFSNVEVVNQHPFPADVILQEENELAVRFNQLFYSDQDYGVIARKTV